MCAVKNLLLVCIIIGCLPVIALAEQTQSYNKLYLSPFYRASMTNGQNYTYSITISPPDKVSSVLSAIVSFDIYINPTVTFNLWVNNKSCNNPTYTISTTYSGAGQARVTFDCSNVITKDGNYQIILQPTQANTGTINGWIDLTYINNPKGTLEISGTEYIINDAGTMFVQLKDINGQPVNNGACYADIWYPSTPNSTHPYTIIDAPMIKAQGDDGLYYYDLTLPSIAGVYMLSAKCAYSYNYQWFYAPESTSKSNRTVIQGTYTGDTIVLNSYSDGLYTKCTSTSGGGNKYCEAYYDFNVSGINASNISLFFAGESSGVPIMYSYVFNWSSGTWVSLPNNLTFTGTATAISPNFVDEFVTNNVPLNGTINASGMIRIRLYTVGGASFSKYDNWLSLEALSAEGTIQDVKGSSEMHISNLLANITRQIDNISQGASNISNQLNAVNQSLFSKINDTLNVLISVNSSIMLKLSDVNVSIYNRIDDAERSINQNITSVNATILSTNSSLFNKLIQIDNNVISVNDTMLSINGSTFLKLDNINNSLTATMLYVQNNINGTLLSVNGSLYGFISDVNISTINKLRLMQDEIASVNQTVKDSNQSIMSYLYNLNSTIVNLNNMVMSSLNQISIDIGNIIGNFTSVGSLFLQNIAQEVWGYQNRTLTDFNFTVNTTVNITIPEINASQISDYVWNNTNRTLTSFDNFDYSRPAIFVWNQTDRQLTAFNFDVVNENTVSEFVWNYTNRTLTDFDYAKAGLYVWNSTTRTLTEINATNITGNVTINWYQLTGCQEGDLPRCIWKFFWYAGAVP